MAGIDNEVFAWPQRERLNAAVCADDEMAGARRAKHRCAFAKEKWGHAGEANVHVNAVFSSKKAAGFNQEAFR